MGVFLFLAVAAISVAGAEDKDSGSASAASAASAASEKGSAVEAETTGERGDGKDSSDGRRGRRGPRFSGHSGNREGWSSLSDEERSKLREALREVWTDTTVVSAREEVRRASEAYHKAVRDAVEGTDPSVEPLLTRLHGLRDGSRSDRGKKGHGRRFFASGRGMEAWLQPPGFLERLSDEQRERFDSAQAEAKESPEVVAAMEKLEEIRKEDEAIRGRKLRALRGVRKSFNEALAEADPEIADLLPKSGERRGRGGKKEAEEKPDGE